MKKQLLFLASIVTLFTACGNQQAAETEGANGAFFPVASYLRGQASHIDTSLYTLIQVNKTAQTVDTVYIAREDFKKLVEPFTSLPEIASGKLQSKYTESRLYDEALDRFIITYTPKELDEDLEIQRQDVVITPNTGDGDNVESVYIERQLSRGDSTVQQKMSWEAATGFTIRTIIQKKNSPEKLQNTEVAWLSPRSAAKL